MYAVMIVARADTPASPEPVVVPTVVGIAETVRVADRRVNVAATAVPRAVASRGKSAARAVARAARPVAAVAGSEVARLVVEAVAPALESVVRPVEAATVARRVAPHAVRIVVVTVDRAGRAVPAPAPSVRMRRVASLATVRRRSAPRRAVNGRRVASSSRVRRVRARTHAATTGAMIVGRAVAAVRHCRFAVVRRENNPA